MPTVTLKTQPNYGLPRLATSLRYQQLVKSTTGLVLYWRLNEASGTTAVDLGGSHNGTYNNSPSMGLPGPIVNDNASYGVSLDKTSSQTITNSSFVGPTGAWTMMCWARAGALPQQPGLLVHFGSTSNGGGFAIGNANDGNSSGLVFLNSGSGWVDLSYTWPNTTSWHFICVTGASGTGTAYVDGAQIGSTFSVFGTTPSAGVIVGGETSSSRMATATVTDAAIFSTNLMASQIATLYRVGTKGV